MNRFSFVSVFFIAFCLVIGGVSLFPSAASAKSCEELAKDAFGINKYRSAGCTASTAACQQTNGVTFTSDDCTGGKVCCVVASVKLCNEIAEDTYGKGNFDKAGCVGSRKRCDDLKGNALSSKDCTGTAVCCVEGAKTSAGSGSGTFVPLKDPLAGATLYTLISRLITAFLGMVGALAFAVFVYAGVTWMTAGSSERVQHAKDAMKYAVIGILMIGLSYAVTVFVITAFTRSGS